MFPRAPRFEEPRAAEVPGPNSYDPTEPQANYKRGAMFEKDARFKNGQQQLLTPSPPRATSPCQCAKRGASPSSQRVASLEREKAKLEARLAKAEEQAHESARRSNAVSAEKGQLQTELRLLTQRYEKLQDQQASATRRSVARESMGNSATQQVEELKRMLEAERSQHADDLAQIKTERDAAHKTLEAEVEKGRLDLATSREEHAAELNQARALLYEARQALETERSEHKQRLGQLQGDFEKQMPQLEQARVALEDERNTYRKKMNRMSAQLILGEQERREAHEKRMSLTQDMSAAQEKQAALESEMAVLQNRLEASNNSLVLMSTRCVAAEDDLRRLQAQSKDVAEDRLTAQDAMRKLDARYNDTQEELAAARDAAEEERERADSFESRCKALLKSAMQFAKAYREEQEQHKATRLNVRLGYISRQQLGSGSSPTSRSRSSSASSSLDGRLAALDVAEVQATSNRTVSRRSSQDLSLPTSSSMLLRHLDATVEEAKQSQNVLASTSRLLQEHDSLRLELSEERSEWLNERMDELHEQYLKALQASGSHTDLLRKIDKLRGELATVEEAYEASVLERMRATRSEEELKSELLETQIECAGLSKRLQELESERTTMANVYRREEAWAHERSSLLDELAHAAHYEAAYADLHSEAQTLLVRVSTRADIRIDELNRLGATLSAQANPRNNVLYMDRIRRQLDEARLQSHAIEGERDQLRAQVRALQGQLDVNLHFGAGGRNTVQASPLSLHNVSSATLQSQQTAELAGLGLSLDGLTEGERERHAAKTAWQQRPRGNRAGRTLREQRSTPRLRQTTDNASDTAAQEAYTTQILAQRPNATNNNVAYAGTSASSVAMITPSMMSASAFGGTSQADSSSLLLSPASIQGYDARLAHDEGSAGGFLSRLVKTVGGGNAGHQPHAAHDKPSALVSNTFAMPLDDGQFGFEDLT